MDTPVKLLEADGWEYWQVGDEIRRAGWASTARDEHGCPTASRFYCYLSSWELAKRLLKLDKQSEGTHEANTRSDAQ